MAVTVNDKRGIIDEADATTGWTSAVSIAATSDPTPAEDTNCISAIVSKTSAEVYHTHTAINCGGSGELVYAWLFNRGAPVTTALGGIGLLLGDGTNRIGYHLAGSDRKAFSHDETQPYFMCLVMDTNKRTTDTLAWAGSEASLNLSALTQFGVEMDNGAAKATGGVANYFVDIIRVGNSGICIEGGTTGDRGTFLEVATEDRSTGNQKALGIIRELSTGLYGLQGPIQFGHRATAADSYFEDENVVLAFENRYIGDDKYFIYTEGASGQTNYFSLSNSTITSAGPAVTCDFSLGNVDTLVLDTVTFTGLRYPITFSNNADATGHDVTGCSFIDCGQIDPGDVTFSSNTISNPTNSGVGGFIIDSDGASNISDITFNSGGAGHAIYVADSGYYTFSDFTYNGYGSTGTTDASVYNDSGGGVSITIDGGAAPTYRNGAAGSTTTLISSVPITITVKDADGNLITDAQVAMYEGTTQIMNEDTVAGVATESYTGSTPASVEVRIRKGSSIDTPKYLPISSNQTIGTGGLTVTFTLLEDTNNNA